MKTSLTSHRLIHGYASLADEVVWSVLASKLPILRHEVSSLLADAGDATDSPAGGQVADN